MGNIRAEKARGAKNDRGGLLDLGVTHIDCLPRVLTYGLQVIKDLHLRGVEFRSLADPQFGRSGRRSMSGKNWPEV